MNTNGGYIYVLINPSFPEYVKIGYADNVDERVAQLNRSECTPFAFRKYAILHVKNRLADKNIHKLIDTFKPELRAKENVNGKMRVREFFAMSADEAVELLGTIGNIYGEVPQVFQQTSEQKREQQLAEEASVASERRSPFSFYKCGIQNGEQIVYVNDSKIVCTVAGDREINYNGKKTSLSALAGKLLNRKRGVQGPLYFSYKGEVLSALRKRLEDEGKYHVCVKNKTTERNIVVEANNSATGRLLYFVMDKYKAVCKWSEEGFLLLKGSKVSCQFSSGCPESVKILRNKYADFISDDYVVTENILFSSSSAAAKFVAGSSINGKLYWKDQNGILLRDLLPKGDE